MGVVATSSERSGRRSRLRSQVGAHRQVLARSAVLTLAALLVGYMFTASYVGALYKPSSHGVPLAAEGPSSVLAELQTGGAFTVHQVPSRAQALRRIDDRDDLGAVIATPSGFEVLTAASGNLRVSVALQTLLPAELSAAADAPVRTRVVDVKPLPTSDSTGLTPFYLALSLVVSNFIGAALFGMVFGTQFAGRAIWTRLLGCGLIALVLALSQVGIVLAFGAVSGHYVSLVLAALLIGYATVCAAIGLQALLGPVGGAISMLVFVVLGNPASGVAFPTQMLPGLWRWLGPYLPVGAGLNLIKGIIYFGGNGTATSALVLSAWLTLGFAFAALASYRTRTPAISHSLVEAT
jgi:hypothetical protein